MTASALEEKWRVLEQNRYLQEHWGAYIAAAGYKDLTLSAEEALHLGGIICQRIRPRVYAMKHGAVVDGEYLDVLNAMSDEERADLRAEIKFVQEQYIPQIFTKKKR